MDNHERESQVAPPVVGDNNHPSVGASRIGDQRAENAEPKHTPWTAEYQRGPSGGWRIVNRLGDCVCQGTHSMFDERDFPFIAAAVNSHADMLAALRLVDNLSSGLTGAHGGWETINEIARAAISKATGAAS